MTHRDASSLAGAERTRSAPRRQVFWREARATHVRDTSELEAVIAAQAHEPTVALIVLNGDFTIAYRVEIVSLDTCYRLPAVYPFRFFAELGNLISCGVDLSGNFSACGDLCRSYSQGHEAQRAPVQAPSSSKW